MTDDHPDDPTNPTGETTTDGGTDEAAETPIHAGLVESVATDENVPREDLTSALVVLNASFIGLHSTYEREYEYVTIEGVRAYIVDVGAWETLRAEHDLDSRLARAAQRAHTEQARRLCAVADDSPEDIEAGIVIGIDTAEVMD